METRIIIAIMLGVLLFNSCKQQSTLQSLSLSENWEIAPSSKVGEPGNVVSKNNFSATGWYNATVPSTIMGNLSSRKEYSTLFIGDNYFKTDKKLFDQPWWYRTSFNLNELKNGNAFLLQFDGISYCANIWLNGNSVASKDQAFGTYRRFEFDISKLVKKGQNTLAIEIFHQQPGDFGLGFVDWNPKPLDANMGLWRGVTIQSVDRLQLKNCFVRCKLNTATLNEAWLTVGVPIKNFTHDRIEGKIQLSFDGIKMNYPVTLLPGETKEVVLTSNELEPLHLKNPKLWWCNGLGEPNLYNLKIKFIEKDEIRSSENVTFGVRQIESYFNMEGHRGFKLNGKEILIKGAGWTDDIFLRNKPTDNEIQVQYVKDMGLNTIRLEGFWGNSQNLYDLCDKYGILIMAGWSCQWEWDDYLGKHCDNFGGITTDSDINLVSQYMRDQVTWLRNHPSVFVWMVGSDMIPRPAMEKEYCQIFSELDDRPWVSAASTRKSDLTGPTGVKMNGPYEYVGPSYWYLDKNNGGAFGFNTETGPGPLLPVSESVEKIIPADKRWPLNNVWDKHCTVSGAGMNSLKLQEEIITAQYGAPQGFDDFVLKCHLSNYEAIRAMFEAFRANRPNSTGIIQWMLNSAWPSFYWQLYDYYLVPSPAYYAVKKALQPVQLIYDYGNRSILFSNETLDPLKEAKAEIKVYDINSKLLFSKNLEISSITNTSEKILTLPDFKQLTFLKTVITTIDGKKYDNFYWLSANSEKFDWTNTKWYYTPMKEYSDYSDLKNLTMADVEWYPSVTKENDVVTITLKLKNQGNNIAFFNELKLLNMEGEWVVPSFISDNYFTLISGEEKTVEIKVLLQSLIGQKPTVWLSGWNTKEEHVQLETID
jgi:exo-1,4-beta-D-glucosaminidase